jgi:hypothetical protein
VIEKKIERNEEREREREREREIKEKILVFLKYIIYANLQEKFFFSMKFEEIKIDNSDELFDDSK